MTTKRNRRGHTSQEAMESAPSMSNGQTASAQACFGRNPLSVDSGRSLPTQAKTIHLPDLESLSLEETRHLVRQLHLKLIESEKSLEQYRAVVEDQTEVISRFRNDGTFTFVNRVFCRFFGKQAQELIGERWQTVAVLEDVPAIEAQLRLLSPANPVVVIENRVYSGTGQVHRMQFVNRAFFDAAGNLQEIQSVGRDITERNWAEEAQRESERRFSALFEASPVSIAVTRLSDSRIVDVNPAWLEATGFTREEVIGRTPLELKAWVHPEDRARLLAMLRDQGRVLNFEFPMRHKSGAVIDVLLSAEQIAVAGEPHMLSLAQDITERKRAEELVRERDEFTQAILNSVSSHIAVVAPNGVIVAVNDPWRRFAIENGTEPGRPARNTEVGVNYLQICRESRGESSEGAMTAHDGIRAVLEGALPGFTLEYPCHSPGLECWFIMSVTPLGKGENGAVIIHTDISARRRVEEALRESEERNRSLVGSSMDAVLLTVPDGRILAANEAACRMFGYSEAELIAMGRRGVVDGSDPRLAAALEERARTGRFRGELTFFRKDGTKFPGEMSTAVFANRSGELRTSMVIRDITLRKRTEQALRFNREQLQTLARRLIEVQETSHRELARELHDRVGQNLTALNLNLNMLSELLPAEGLSAIGTWLDDSQKLVAETMDHVRDVMAELRPPGLDDFGLVAVLRWYADEFARRSGLTVAVHCPAPFPRLPREQEISLFRIVQEALTNVGKHARAQSVTVAVQASSVGLAITVTDDGIGFDPATPNTRPCWGLIAMRERALAMGWELHIESESGRGTAVRVEVTDYVHSCPACR